MGTFATKVLSAKLGETHVFSVGQAGYIVKSATGCLLGVDLYLSECVEREEATQGFKRLLPQILEPFELEFDVVICTHPHWDHFDVDTVPKLLSNKKTKLFCSMGCRELIARHRMNYFETQITYVKPTESFAVEDIIIDFVNCDHGYGAPDAVGVVITTGGKRVYMTGDTCLRLDRVEEIPKPVDVLIAPINGAYGNLNEEECSRLSETLNPYITIPCHYGMFALHHGDVGKFYEIMREKELPVLLMRQGEQYTL